MMETDYDGLSNVSGLGVYRLHAWILPYEDLQFLL